MAEQRIGKYRIVERIGRGGMGMIFKAHDPLLDRLVALKVISSDVEITDELRARFFREAQACARLNHPNIVTVYDMGEDEGRLFIVMELLEGQELRRLISQRAPMSLESKLGVIVQVCAGLHYAHGRGIVHRDMKPGNIFLLGTGQVKVLDFGIAHMATTEGLTRTGMIMGTLRYISPEQVRGRADHRSDMFSIGSVLYELLTWRPPFTGDDPMQLLEQLRTEDPPPVSELAPELPPELTTIVQRAMRKNPEERYRDLEEMQEALEGVRRAIDEERHRVGVRVRGQREQVIALQASAAEVFEGVAVDTQIPAVDDRQGLLSIQALERELAGRIAALETRLAQADAVAPTLERAEALEQSGRFEEAVAQFEALLADVPEHRRAREGLERARARAEVERRRRRGQELFEKANVALGEQRYAACMQLVDEALGLSLPAELGEALRGLRERAEAEQEAQQRARRAAEEAQKVTATVREAAQAEDAPQYAPAAWNEALRLVATAEAALRRNAYAEAQAAFEGARAAYHRALDRARQAQEEARQAADRARDAAALGQQHARAAGAPQYARELWEGGEAKLVEAQTEASKKAAGRAGALYAEALALYRRAEDAAREAAERERRRAAAARDRAEEGRRSAAAVDAEHRAPTVWAEAVRNATAAEAAWVRKQYARAAEAFEAALRLYHDAQGQAREAIRRQRDESRRKQDEMAEVRRQALGVDAAAHAAGEWAEAEASASAAEAAVDRGAGDEALAALDRALVLYRGAFERAQEIVRARSEAERAEETSRLAREAAAGVEASRLAPEPWKAAESAQARAVAALSQQRYPSARSLFAEAERLYADARSAGSIAADAEARRIQALIADARGRLDAGNPAGCLELVVTILTLKPGHGEAEALRAAAQAALARAGSAPAPTGRPVPPPRVDALGETVIRHDTASRVVVEPPVERQPAVVPADIPPPAEEADRPLAPARRKPRRLQAAVIGVGVLAALGLITVAWPRKDGARPPVKQDVAGPATARPEGAKQEAAAAKQEAERQRAAQEATRQDAARQLAAKQEAAKQETARQEAARQEAARQEAARQLAAKQEAARQEAAKQEAAKQEAAQQEIARQEAAKQEAAKQEVARQEAARQEAARQEAARQEAARQEAARQLAVKQEAARQEAAKQEAARQEALRQEAARREAARQLAAKQEAAKQEAARQEAARREAAAREEAARQQAAKQEAARQEAARREAAAREEAARQEAARQQAARQETERQRVAALQRRQADAEQARTQMLGAKRAAEESGAPRYAAKLLAAAQGKERDAQAALTRSDFDAAGRLFRDAQSDYQGAAQEASREAEMERRQLAMLKAGADEARNRAANRRAEAVKSEAERLAKPAFDAGQAKQAEADGLVTRQNFAAASQAYQDAAERYMEAAMRAQTVREARNQADAARTRMLAEKQRGRQDAVEFKAALAEEKLAASLYDKLSFKEAAERFLAAEVLFSRSAVAPPPAVPAAKPPAQPPRRQLPPSF